MKEYLTQRLADLEAEYKKLESDREIISKKLLFISGAFEEIKLLIKKLYPECEPEAK